MKERTKDDGVEVALLAAIFGFVAFAVFVCFQILIGNEARSAWTTFFGAFVGAFFAFLFVRLGEYLRRTGDRKAKHYNALVGIQHHVNDIFNMLSANVFLIDHFIDPARKKERARGRINLPGDQLREVTARQNLAADLTDIDLANRVFGYNADLIRLNQDMASFNRGIDKMNSAILSRSLEGQDLEASFQNYEEIAREIRRFLLETEKESKTLYASARVLIRHAPLAMRLSRALTQSKKPRDFDDKVKKAELELGKELEESANKSLERIQRARSRDPGDK